MHLKILCGVLLIAFLAVTTAVGEEETPIVIVENCQERIEQCKKVATDQDDDKKAEAQAQCYSSFMCSPDVDFERQTLMMDAGARTAAARGNRFKTGMSPTTKISLNLLAVCLVTVLGFGRL